MTGLAGLLLAGLFLPATAQALSPSWQRSLGDPGETWTLNPPISPSGDAFFHSTGGQVAVVRTESGALGWTASVGSDASLESLLTPDGKLILARRDGDHGRVVALDAATGQTAWSYLINYDPVVTSLACTPDGTLFVAARGSLHSLQTSDGAVNWVNPYVGPGDLQQITVSYGIVTALRVYETPIRILLYELDAYSASTGSRLWTTDKVGPPGAVPTGDGAFVVVASQERLSFVPDGFAGLDAMSGFPLWKLPGSGRTYPTPPVVGEIGIGLACSSGGVLGRIKGGESAVRVLMSFPSTATPTSPVLTTDGAVYFLNYRRTDGELSAFLNSVKLTNSLSNIASPRQEILVGAGTDSGGIVVGPEGSVLVTGVTGSIKAFQGAAPLANVPWAKLRSDSSNSGVDRSYYSDSPRIVRISPNLAALAGSSVALEALVAGARPMSYEWWHSGRMVSSTPDRLLLQGITPADSGVYHLVARNSFGSVTSAPVELTALYRLRIGIEGSGHIEQDPAGTNFPPGTVIHFRAIPAVEGGFLGWTGGIETNATSFTATLNDHTSLLARFVPGPGSLKFTTRVGPLQPTATSTPAIGPDGVIYRLFGDLVVAIDGQSGQVKWDFQVPGGLDTECDPVITDRGFLIFCGATGDGRLICLNPATREIVWRKPYRGKVTLGSAVFAFAQDVEWRVEALDPANGMSLWSGPDDLESFGEPLLNGGDLFLGHRFRLDAADGRATPVSPRWDPDGGAEPSLDVIGADGSLIGWEAVTVGGFVAVDPVTGKKQWIRPTTGNRWSIQCRTVVGPDNKVYGGNHWGFFSAVDGFTGEHRWGRWLSGPVTQAPAVAADGTVYVPASSEVAALNTADGAIVWRRSMTNAFGEPDGTAVSSATIGPDGTVYVGTDYGLAAFVGTAKLADSPWPKHRGDLRNTGRRGDFAPLIYEQPKSWMYRVGTEVNLAVGAHSQPPVSVHWYRDGELIGSAAEPFSLSPFRLDHAGLYHGVVSNSVGAVVLSSFRVYAAEFQGADYLRLRVQSSGPAEAAVESASALAGPWQEVERLTLSSGEQSWIIPQELSGVGGWFRVRTEASVAVSAAGEPIFGVGLAGSVGARRRVDYVDPQTGWENWQTLTNVTFSAPSMILEDHSPSIVRPRFYRMVDSGEAPR